MCFSLAIFCLLIVLLLTGVIPVGGGQHANAVYYSPVFILLLALLSGASVWCCICRKFSLKQAGFYLVHLGVVVILCGAFVGYVAGTKGSVQLSLRSGLPVGQVVAKDGRAVPFGFDVSAEDFEVKFYPPVYQHYRPLPPEKVRPGQMPFEAAEELNTDGQDEWMIEGVGLFAVSNLWDAAHGAWVERWRLSDGSVLFLSQQTPSFYGVTLRIGDEKLPVSINHPAHYKGWRFYLVSYDQRNRTFVQLSARRDPGRPAVIAGIWVLMIGTFTLCFRKASAGWPQAEVGFCARGGRCS